MTTLYPTDVDFATIDELRAAARARLDQPVFDFLEGGAGAELTLRANQDQFRRWAIAPEPMSGVTNPDTNTTIEAVGLNLKTPILVAPFGGDSLFHPEGHHAVARAAEDCGAAVIVPEAGSHSYAAIHRTAPAAAAMAQLHPVEHAPQVAAHLAALGFRGLCVTVDCPVGGYRTRNMRNRFDPDMRAFAGNLATVNGTPAVAEAMSRLVGGGNQGWTWDHLRTMSRESSLPWIAKGVLTVAAAQRAIDAGAFGVIVSNHGGRQLDPAPPPLSVLAAIRSALGPEPTILVDSGFRTGAHAFIALALGADAVVIGRAAAYGLTAAGQHGVTRVIQMITDELCTLMKLAGAPDIPAIRGRVTELLP